MTPIIALDPLKVRSHRTVLHYLEKNTVLDPLTKLIDPACNYKETELQNHGTYDDPIQKGPPRGPFAKLLPVPREEYDRAFQVCMTAACPVDPDDPGWLKTLLSSGCHIRHLPAGQESSNEAKRAQSARG